jgi:hypothetical protein
MRIAIIRPINGISLNGDEYIIDEDGAPIEFDTVKEAINFLLDRNYAASDLRELNFIIDGDA